MRHEDLRIKNLTSDEQVERIKELVTGITGASFVSADLDGQTIDFDLVQDLDDLTLTDVQCALRDAGFDAGEVEEGQTCAVRLRAR